jgi:ADP-heptose:LPS heptosyltransferase
MADLFVTSNLGGGIGDCVHDWLHEPEFRKLFGLVTDYGARTRLIVQCHCAGAEDLFQHNPYVHEVRVESWRPPNLEDSRRFNEPDGEWIPLSRNDLLFRAGVRAISLQAPQLYLSEDDQRLLGQLLERRPAIVLQPYAGLSDRDGFDPPAIQRLCEALLNLNDQVSILIIGKNHERGHKYAREEVLFEHPQVTNLIDQLGIRVAYHLTARCDAFCGAHSNLIRTAWDHRRRCACVMPSPLMTDHLPKLDPKYTYGFRQPEVRQFTYHFEVGGERQFWTLDTESLARFLLYG